MNLFQRVGLYVCAIAMITLSACTAKLAKSDVDELRKLLKDDIKLDLQEAKIAVAANTTIIITTGTQCKKDTTLMTCCTQQGSNTSTDYPQGVDKDGNAIVHSGDVVTWTIVGPNINKVDVVFPLTNSPFFDLANNSSSVTAGIPIGPVKAVKHPLPYEKVSWNSSSTGNGSCKNVGADSGGNGQLGIVMQ